MNTRKARYRRHRFPPEIISYSVWAYHRFALSFRDVEDLLAERDIIVSYESIRRWCLKFGPCYRRSLRRREGQLGDHWYADEVFVTIQGQIHYLWRAVDQDGTVLDILVQRRRDAKAAKRFFRKVLKGQGEAPRRLFSDKLGSYRVAARELLPGTPHDTSRYANNRVELSHQPTRQQKRQMRRFKSRTRHNDSYPFTHEWTISSATAAICSAPPTIGCSGREPSQRGGRSRAPEARGPNHPSQSTSAGHR